MIPLAAVCSEGLFHGYHWCKCILYDKTPSWHLTLYFNISDIHWHDSKLSFYRWGLTQLRFPGFGSPNQMTLITRVILMMGLRNSRVALTLVCEAGWRVGKFSAFKVMVQYYVLIVCSSHSAEWCTNVPCHQKVITMYWIRSNCNKCATMGAMAYICNKPVATS